MLAIPAIKPVFINNMAQNKKLLLGISDRSLRTQTLELLEGAGYAINISLAGHRITLDDPEIECFVSGAHELADWVQEGILDICILQKARLLDQGIKVKEIAEFKYGTGIWDLGKVVVAVPDKSPIKTIKDLQGKEILSRLPNLTENFLKANNLTAKIIRVSYPSEPKGEMLGKPVVDFTNTGKTLKEHNMRVLAVIMTTSPRLIMNNKAYQDKWKREKAETLAMLLQGARLAKDMIGLMMHVSHNILPAVLKILPAMKKPTVTQLRGESVFDVLTVINKQQSRVLLPQLKALGCTDIVEFPLDRVIV